MTKFERIDTAEQAREALLEILGDGAKLYTDYVNNHLAGDFAVALARKINQGRTNWARVVGARTHANYLKSKIKQCKKGEQSLRDRLAKAEEALRAERAKGLAPCRHELTEGHTRTTYESKAIGAWICVDSRSDSDEFGAYTDLTHIWAGDVDILPMLTSEQANKVLLEVIRAARNPEV